MSKQYVNQILRAIQSGLEASISDWMPAGAYRNFWLWAMRAAAPHGETWLQAIAAVQIAQLTQYLFNGIASDDHDWELLAEGTAPLAVYLVHEQVSDDLALYLAERRRGDDSYQSRRLVLEGFNQMMVRRLRNAPFDGLHRLRQLADVVPILDQKLCSDKHRAVASAYLQEHDGLSLDDLSYGAVWPSLVVNLQTACNVVEVMRNCVAGPLVTAGLQSRYEGVNQILCGALDLKTRVETGRDTILVVPTLAYYVSLWSEKVRPNTHFFGLVFDGTLEHVLQLAASQSRLLNDLGSLVLQPPVERRAMFQGLADAARPGERLSEVILAHAKDYGSDLTRLEKDLTYGEFNTCLDDLRGEPAEESLDALEHRVAYCADLYAAQRVEFEGLLKTLSAQRGCADSANVIGRFVTFHEVLYARSHKQLSGEYCV
jgi:hypothetical protein